MWIASDWSKVILASCVVILDQSEMYIIHFGVILAQSDMSQSDIYHNPIIAP